ncbi:MAG: Fe-S cluster assembly protein SufD [Bacteroidia bacterium]
MITNTLENIKSKTTASQKVEELIISEFENQRNALWGDVELRKLAIKSFAEQGIPKRKNEEYKYINFDLILKEEFTLSTNKTEVSKGIENLFFLKNATNIVIHNGVFIPELSTTTNLPKGLIISNIAEASKKHTTIFEQHYSKVVDINSDAFIALNTALTVGGVFMYIEKNAIIETPIHIIHISNSTNTTITNPRNLIVVESGAQTKIIESYQTINSSIKTINNALTEIVVNANAIVDHYKIQDEGDFGNLINTTHSVQQQHSVFSTNTFILSGSLVRNNLNIILNDKNIESHLNGLYLTKSTQQVDNHTLVDHRMPNCNSNELYKGIVDEKSTATFNGKIFVRKDAQQTNAFQSNKNILLSDDGTINTKPQLEIYADDVKCSHGTSTGKLDEEKIFYLRARGLSETSAKKMLLHAFASEVTDTIKIEELKEYVEAKIASRFE